MAVMSDKTNRKFVVALGSILGKSWPIAAYETIDGLISAGTITDNTVLSDDVISVMDKIKSDIIAACTPLVPENP